MTQECPDADNLKRLQEIKAAYVNKRIQQEINRWDNETRIFEGVQDNLVASFDEECATVENLLKKEELRLIGKTVDKSSSEYEYTYKSTHFKLERNRKLTNKQIAILGVTSPFWVPLGLVVGIFALPAFGIKRLIQRKKEHKQLGEYRAHRGEEMAEATKVILDGLNSESAIEDVVRGRFVKMTEEFKTKLNHIHAWIAEDKKLLKEQKNTLDKNEQAYIVQDLIDEGEALENQLNSLYLCHLRNYPFEITDFTDREMIGTGGSAEVWKAKWKPPDAKDFQLVALKILDQPIETDPRSASEFLLEEENLK